MSLCTTTSTDMKTLQLLELAKYGRDYSEVIMMRYLLENGANPNAIKFMDGDTVLMLAVLNSYGNSTEMVQLLLEEGANPNKKGRNGMTALRVAAICGSVSGDDRFFKKIRLLLDKGADINMQDKDGYTALMCVAEHIVTENGLKMMRFLLENGADVKAQNRSNGTALSIAEEHECKKAKEMVQLLLEYGAALPSVSLVKSVSSTSSGCGGGGGKVTAGKDCPELLKSLSPAVKKVSSRGRSRWSRFSGLFVF